MILLAALSAAEPKPANVRTSTWVREDLFAGFLGGDKVRFEQGMTKLDGILAAQPNAPEALAWRASGELFRAVMKVEAGEAAGFATAFAAAQASFARAWRLAQGTPAVEAVFAITGGTMAVFGDRLPAAHRREAWALVRENYTALRASQGESFAKLPVHMRGEVLAGLAQASQRLGELDKVDAQLKELIDAVPGSVYATRAARWQQNPDVANRTAITCQSCHEPGQLAAVQARLAGAK